MTTHRSDQNRNWDLPHRVCGHGVCGQHYIDTGDLGCIVDEEELYCPRCDVLQPTPDTLRCVCCGEDLQ